MTLSRRDITALLAEHGLRPSRALGQNFVVDPNTVRRVARLAALEPGERVVEIGAGLGSLTMALLEQGAQVTAIELDRGLLPILRSIVEPAGARVIAGDALTMDWAAVLGGVDDARGDDATGDSARGDSARGWTLVANLPYNVATPLVVTLLEEVPAIRRMLVMVQREAGERFAAAVGDDAYGAVSVKVAYWASASVVGAVPPTVFYPRPRVDSALVAIERRERPAVDTAVLEYGRFEGVVRAGFAHRRKMLRRSLDGVVDPSAFPAVGVAPEARAEELDVHAWGEVGGMEAERALAKLTLSLRVVGRRPDGYHLLAAEMVTLNLADRLFFDDGGDGIEVVGPFDDVPSGEDNLVARALRAVDRRAFVRLEKAIRPGAGLGGGSADAAAVLRWAGRDDPALAATLGADVPFCLTGGRAAVSGVGEVVDPLPFDEGVAYTLLTPPFGVSTAAVYAAWDELGGPTGDGPNDLEGAALAVEPRLGVWRDLLGNATGLAPSLAGSGSTWFVPGAFGDIAGAVVAHTASS